MKLCNAVIAMLCSAAAQASTQLCEPPGCRTGQGWSFLQTGGHVTLTESDSLQTMPAKCVEFTRHCGIDVLGDTASWKDSWADVANAFDMCCLGAGHQGGICKGVAEELVAPHNGTDVNFTEPFCDTLMDLYDAHLDNSKDRQDKQSQNVVVTVQQRAKNLYDRAQKLSLESPALVGMLFSAALAQIGRHHTPATVLLDVSKISVAVTLTAIATLVERCGKGAKKDISEQEKPSTSNTDPTKEQSIWSTVHTSER